MRLKLLRSTLVGATAAAFLVVGTGQAMANHVNCGDTITQDTKLDSDLLNCPGDGVVIGAPNITLDLNGHLIDGVPPSNPQAPGPARIGIKNTAGHDGVTVIDGRVREFTAQVHFADASDSLITRLTVTGSPGGIGFQGDSDRNVISRNISEGAIGFFGDPDDNLIERNTVATTFSLGIQILNVFPLTPPEGNRIERNGVSATSTGIDVGGFDTIVERNQVSGAQDGIFVGGVRTRVAQNSVSNGGRGIVLGQAFDTQLVKNDVVANTGDGIFLPHVAVDTLIDQNTANRNGDDGIDVESASTTLTKNTANFNSDLGIEAVPGVIDGGGNKARGNGNPAQCLNVECK